MPTDEQLGSLAPPVASDEGAAATSPFAGVTWSTLPQFMLKHPVLSGLAVPPLAPTLGVASGMQSLLAPSQDMQDRVAEAKNLPESAPQVPGAGTATPQSPAPVVPGGAMSAQAGGMMAPPSAPNVALPRPRDYSGQIDAGLKLQQQGAQQAADAEAKAAQIRAQTQADMATQQLAQAKQSQVVRDAAFADVNQKMAETQKQMDEAAQDKVDPNHWWSSRNGAQKASALLGLALSNFGAAFSHQQPVNLIGQEIDRDIAAQRENIANRRSGLAQKMNLYERQYQIFGNHQDATDMTKAHMLEGLARQGEAAAQQAAVPAIAANALKTSGELSTAAANLKSQVAQRQFEQQYQAGMLKLDAYGKQLQAYQLKAAQNAAGTPGGKITPKDREDITKQEAAVRNIEGAAKENSDALKSIGTGDRARHYLSKATAGLVEDSPKYGKLSAAQEAMAVNSNLAQGIQTAQTEKQYENMREGANTPNSPDKGIAFGMSQVEAARNALAATYASKYGLSLDQAQALVDQKFPSPWANAGTREEIRKKYGSK